MDCLVQERDLRCLFGMNDYDQIVSGSPCFHKRINRDLCRPCFLYWIMDKYTVFRNRDDNNRMYGFHAPIRKRGRPQVNNTGNLYVQEFSQK